ncbi:sodium-dependent proline transporter-like [Haliotis rufescens]|uniref:sodium-dependent proline transporter-like n=1 Tax=Haliotis rufescens TaxID=6454 RepID=UPI00201F1A45|nr:sodium-dependent proline transporter-like [Haliotis rufescens]XP_048239156.1 sodium-dependent proline transporter-like [Haliotis rufescens]
MANNTEDVTDAGIPMTEFQPRGSDRSDTPQHRGSWSSHLDYMLTMVGYSVGFGNLLRFPYLCNRNGGGAFLIPFILFLLVTGFPMLFLESSMSQFSGKAVKHVWSFSPMFKGIGIGTLLITFLYTTFYTVFVAWPIYYMVRSCSSVLPWTTCGNSWNTDLCVDGVNSTFSSNMTALAGNTTNTIIAVELWENVTLAHTPAEEFWQYNVLNISTGLEDVGSVQWHIVGCLFAAFLVIFVCLIRGVKSAGKVVYVTALLPYILLIAIFIRTLLQPGATDGLLYYVVPDFPKLLQIQVWLEASLQVFYSLGPGWGMISTAASYKKFHQPCLRDCLILALVSEGSSVVSGMVTFSILGVMSHKVGVPIANVVSTGPGLGFVTYPEALAQLPLPQLWSFVFFLMLLMVGLDSQFLSMEVVVTALVDEYPRQLGKRRWLVTGVCCLIAFLLGIVFCTQGGPYMFQLLDWYSASLAPMVFCLLECVAVGWIYGIKQMSRDVEMMTGKALSPPLKILLVFVTPATLMVAFIFTLLRYQPPTYGKYEFPSYASKIGWFLAVLPLLPIPVYMVIAVRKHMATNSLKKSVHLAMSPDDDWGPAEAGYREEYMANKANRPTLKPHIMDIFKK